MSPCEVKINDCDDDIDPVSVKRIMYSGQRKQKNQEEQEMPKLKTNRSAAKRFKVTGTGKLKRNKAYRRHILTKKTTKNKRNLRKAVITDETNVANMKRICPYL